MMLEIVVLVYLAIGFSVALRVSAEQWGGAWPPEFQGFMVVMLFWLPVVLLAIALAINSEVVK